MMYGGGLRKVSFLKPRMDTAIMQKSLADSMTNDENKHKVKIAGRFRSRKMSFGSMMKKMNEMEEQKKKEEDDAKLSLAEKFKRDCSIQTYEDIIENI